MLTAENNSFEFVANNFSFRFNGAAASGPSKNQEYTTVNMNRLTNDDRCRLLACLVEGNSIRATVRITNIAKRTVSRLLVTQGIGNNNPSFS